MNISQQILQQKANVYIENGVLTKIRGTGMNSTIHDEFNSKRRSGEKLSTTDIELLKLKSNVVIENENSLEFYNFTGFTQKF